MQQETTAYRRMISGVGVLIVLLPFLTAVGQDRPEILVPRGNDEGVEALRQVAPGDLDTSFSRDGKVRTHFQGVINDGVGAVTLQPDGKIIVAGTSDDVVIGQQVFALARFRSNGAPDSTFGNNGTVTTSFGPTGPSAAFAVALQPDGKIVVAGGSFSFFAGQSSFALARYLPTGTLDPSFGRNGKVITTFSGKNSEAHGLALQPDGKIVVSGSSGIAVGGGIEDNTFVLARYRSNGILDPSFGVNGKVTTKFGCDSGETATALAIQPHDGRIVAAGSTCGPDGLGFIALARRGKRPLSASVCLCSSTHCSSAARRCSVSGVCKM
jgi:uncharacterized delta-60 repeat protein